MNKLRTSNRENKIANLCIACIVFAGAIYGVYWGFRNVSWYGPFAQSTIEYFLICAVSGIMHFTIYVGAMFLIIWVVLTIIKKTL